MKLVFIPNPSSSITSPLEIPACGTALQLVRGSLQGFGGAEADHMTSQTPNQTGATYYFSRYNERNIAFQFYLMSSSFDFLQTQKQNIARYFSASYGMGTLQIYTDSADTKLYEIQAIPDGNASMFQTIGSASSNMCLCSVTMTAFSPMFYDPDMQEVSFSGYGGGFTLPFSYPFSLGTSGIGMVWNNGSTITPATIVINGPFTNPVLTNNRTGESIKVVVALSEGEQLVINTDPDNSSVTFIDSSGNETNMFYAVSTDSVLWKLLPGMNEIEYTDSGLIGNNPITVSWRNEYTGVF